MRAYVAMSKTRLILIALISFGTWEGVQADGGEADLWATARPFNRSFEFGRWATPFVDDNRPPVLELTGLVWDGRVLWVSAHYHNRGSTEPKYIQGRQIDNEHLGGSSFWPYARLEVSNDRDKQWSVVGSSPSREDGTEVTVPMYPDKAAYVERAMPASPTCDIDLSPFRAFIGKFRYGRVVLEGGGESQFVVLADLLPPEPLAEGELAH